MEENVKKCSICKEVKNINLFSKNKSSKDGFKNYCKQCASYANKKYREKYREEINKRNRAFYERSKQNSKQRTEKELQKGVKYCTRCKSILPIENFRQRGNGGFYSTCRKCDNERNREYRLNNYEKYKQQHRKSEQIRNKRKKETKNTFSDYDWKFCKQFFENKCAYCGKEEALTRDHINPLCKGGATIPENILAVCHSCNNLKSSFDFKDWYRKQEFFTIERYNKILEYINIASQFRGNGLV